MRRLKYWLARAKYSRTLLWLPVALLLVPFGHYKRDEALMHITPKSVAVSGYYRRDGTYVNSYNRRPPGSVTHDAPYETAAGIWGVICFVGYVAGGYWAMRFLFYPVTDLLPSKYKEVAISPQIRVPTLSAYGRKEWQCFRCNSTIQCGGLYWYYTDGQGYGSSRQRFCSRCRDALVEQEEQNAEVRLRLIREIFGIELSVQDK